jgi:hypothetical protein
MAEEKGISSISGKKILSALAGGYKAFKEILEIYLFLLNLAEDTRDSIRGSRDNKRQWARIHWSFYKKKEPGFFSGGERFWQSAQPNSNKKAGVEWLCGEFSWQNRSGIL